MKTDELVLAELRQMNSRLAALEAPAARAARRKMEKQDAEALELEKERTRKANLPTAQKAVAIAARTGRKNDTAAGQDAQRNTTHGAKTDGMP